MTPALRWAAMRAILTFGERKSHETAVSTNHNLFEEEGEPKRSRAEALPLTGPKPLPLGQTGSLLLQHNSTSTKYAGRGLSSAERPSAKLQALVYNTRPSRRKGAGKRCSECGPLDAEQALQPSAGTADKTGQLDLPSRADCPCSYERQGE